MKLVDLSASGYVQECLRSVLRWYHYGEPHETRLVIRATVVEYAVHTQSTSFSDEFDLLANVDCFLRRGPESPWGIDWWVRRENADEFANYLDIIGLPYVRHRENDDFDAFVPLTRLPNNTRLLN